MVKQNVREGVAHFETVPLFLDESWCRVVCCVTVPVQWIIDDLDQFYNHRMPQKNKAISFQWLKKS